MMEIPGHTINRLLNLSAPRSEHVHANSITYDYHVFIAEITTSCCVSVARDVRANISYRRAVIEKYCTVPACYNSFALRPRYNNVTYNGKATLTCHEMRLNRTNSSQSCQYVF